MQPTSNEHRAEYEHSGFYWYGISILMNDYSQVYSVVRPRTPL